MKKIIKKFIPNSILDFKEKIRQEIYRDKIRNFSFYFSSKNIGRARELEHKFFFQIKNTKFVSSRGILNSANIHNKVQYANRKLISFEKIAKIKPNSSIYLCSDALINFSKKMIDKIKIPFILVSGNCDLEISPNTIGENNFYRILNNKFLQKWFAQNLTFENKKLINLPLGLDYHSRFEGNNVFGKDKILPFEQEKILINTFINSPNINERRFLAYSNWHFLLSDERKLCLQKIDKSICFFQNTRSYREITWKKESEFVFVLCPQGSGMDTHRTWEAIILGCIPIIKRDGVSNLFNKLPAIIINDWNEISINYLRDEYEKIINKKFDFSSLFLNYWKSKFNLNENIFKINEMAINDFKIFIKSNYS